MKIDFILPAYKRRFLEDAITSILNQTYKDFKLVVVDDCSPEDIKEVVSRFHDPRLSYFRNEKNIGGRDLVGAWTHAMQHATGEWCVLASDDDVYAPTFLEEMVRLGEKYPQCDLVHGRTCIIDADGREHEVAEPRDEFETPVQFAYNRAVRRILQCAPDFMFRVEAWRRIGGFVRFPLAWYSDDATWFLLSRNGVACSRDVRFYFRNSGANISSSPQGARTKLESGRLFLEWFDVFKGTLVASDARDGHLLGALSDGVRNGVMRDACSDLGHAGFGTAMKLIFTFPASVADKLRMLRMTLPYYIKRIVER